MLVKFKKTEFSKLYLCGEPQVRYFRNKIVNKTAKKKILISKTTIGDRFESI